MNPTTLETPSIDPNIDSLVTQRIAPEMHPALPEFHSGPTLVARLSNAKRIAYWSTALAIGTLLGYGIAHTTIGNHESKLVLNKETIGAGGIPVGATVVTSVPVEQKDFDRSIQAVGTLHGFEEFVVSSKLEGRVLRIHADLSSIVKPGDLLLELDSTDAELAKQQSERSLRSELDRWGFQTVPDETIDATQLPPVVSAKLRLELAQSRLKRLASLHTNNAVSEEEWDQARIEARVFESEYENQVLMAKSAVSTVRLKEAELAIASQRVKDCKILAPEPTNIDRSDDRFYTVAERLVSEGTLLRPGTEVFRLVLGQSLKLRLRIAQKNAPEIAVGQSVRVYIDSDPTPQAGTVTRISPAIDVETRTFVVEVDVPNRDRKLKSGGFAKAEIVTAYSPKITCVPLTGVYSLAGIHKVFIIQDGVAREYQVKLGQEIEGLIEIVSPVIPVGSRVVTSGQAMLSDGVSVVDRSDDDQKRSQPNDAQTAEFHGAAS